MIHPSRIWSLWFGAQTRQAIWERAREQGRSHVRLSPDDPIYADLVPQWIQEVIAEDRVAGRSRFPARVKVPKTRPWIRPEILREAREVLEDQPGSDPTHVLAERHESTPEAVRRWIRSAKEAHRRDYPNWRKLYTRIQESIGSGEYSSEAARQHVESFLASPYRAPVQSQRDRILDLLSKGRGTSEIAREVQCEPSYVRRIRRESRGERA